MILHKVKKIISEKQQDHSELGHFSKIHLEQNPLPINPNKQIACLETDHLRLKVDEAGKVNYDITILENVRRGKRVYSTNSALEKVSIDNKQLRRPSKEETKKLLQKVRSNLEQKLNDRLNVTQTPTQLKKDFDKSVFIKYTPVNQVEQIDSGLKSRIIKIHQMPKDPLEPPKQLKKYKRIILYYDNF